LKKYKGSSVVIRFFHGVDELISPTRNITRSDNQVRQYAILWE